MWIFKPFLVAMIAISNAAWGLEVYRADRPSRENPALSTSNPDAGSSLPSFGSSTPYSRSIDTREDEVAPRYRQVDEEPRPGERQSYRTKNGTYRSKLNDNYFKRQAQESKQR